MAAQMLDHLLELMGITADVSIRDAETPGDGLGMAKAVLDIEGDDLGLLIGRRGETLASLQYLLNLMVGRKLTEHATFTVDVEGYRRRREKQLNRSRGAWPTRCAARAAGHARADAAERAPHHPPRRCRRGSRGGDTASVGEGENRQVFDIDPRVIVPMRTPDFVASGTSCAMWSPAAGASAAPSPSQPSRHTVSA